MTGKEGNIIPFPKGGGVTIDKVVDRDQLQYSCICVDTLDRIGEICNLVLGC